MKNPTADFLHLFQATSLRGAVWSLTILVSGLLGTVYFTHHERTDAETDARQEFDASCAEIAAKIQVRMNAHEQILRSGAAFFADDDGVTRSEWREFAERQKINQRLPGIQGIGYALLVPPADLARHLQKIRAEGFPAYRIWPEGERATYTSIVFLEPFSRRNLRAFGYDMFAEPVRRAAMERARDQDAVALSGKVSLVQEDGQDPQAGTLMYAPVYRRHAPHATVAERRAAVLGWVYSPYRMRDLISAGMLGRWDLAVQRQIHLEIFDGATPSPAALLYDSQPLRAHAPAPAATVPRDTVVVHAGHPWLLRFTASDGTGARVDYGKSWQVFGTGVVTSLLLASLALSLANTRHAARLMAASLTVDLRQSEERWKFALEGAGDGLWDWNVATSEVFFSARWKEMLGHAPEEIGVRLEEWRQRVHREDLPRTMAQVQAHLDGRTSSYACEHRLRCKDGTWKWILDRGLVINRGAGGEALRMIGTHTDISVHKQTEAALRESEHRLRTLLESSPEAITVHRQGKIIYANPAAVRFAGAASAADLLGMAIMDRVHPDFHPEVTARVQHMTATHGSTPPAEMKFIQLDGTEFDVETQATEIIYDGEPAIRVVARDITEAKRAAAALRASEARFRTLVEHSPYCIHEIDLAGRLISMNRAGLKMLGVADACSILGLPYLDTVGDRDRERVAALLAGAFAGHAAEFAFQTAGGRELQSSLVPIADETGTVQRLMGLTIDITERRLAEETLQESHARFLSLTAASPDALLVSRTSDGLILYVNEQCGRMLGVAVSELIDRPTTDFYADPTVRQAFVSALRAHGSVTDWEIALKRSDGTSFPTLITARLGTFAGTQAVYAGMKDISERRQAETALRRSEIRYRTLFEKADVGIVYLSPTLHVLQANEAFARMHGYSVAEMAGMDLQQLDSPDATRREPERAARLMAGETLSFTIEHTHRDGHLFPVEITVSVVDLGGEKIIQAFNRDVTARHAAERALAASEENYRLLFDGMLDGFALHEIICDADGHPVDYRYLSVNPAFEHLTGQRGADVLGRTVLELMPTTEPSWIERYGRVALTGEGVEFEEYSRALDKYFEVAAFCPRPGQFAVVFIDVTANKRAEIALRESQEQFRSYIEHAPMGVFIADDAGAYLTVNAAAAATTGYSLAELLTMRAPDLSLPESPESAAHFHRLRETGESAAEVPFRRKDGTAGYWLVDAVALSPTRFLAFTVETTDRKTAELALQSTLHEKEALLKEVHHRVKNNLQVITSLLRMEGRRSAHPETKSVLGYMQGRIRSMALLHETLYRSGTFAGVDLAGYLKQLVTQAFRTHTTAPGTIQLELDLASVHVEMDQALPCGLLVNELVSNALKHAFPLGRTGILRLELQPVAGGPPWRLSVSDTGVGLPADFAARRGQSLGLQLVADLAGQLRGALEIGPAPTGSGTRFAVTFTPAAPKPAAPSPPEPLTPRP